MKATQLFLILILLALAAAGGWFVARRTAPETPIKSSERKVLYYQSAMHPWIKSDQPGKCTICGMELVPVYEGEKGFDAEAGTIVLSSNSINVLHVQTSEAQRRSLRRTLRVAGVIDDNDSRHRIVSAYIDGRIDRLAVNYVGAEVIEGEPLATFYSPQLLTAEREYLALWQQQMPTNSALPREEHQRMISSAELRLQRLGMTEAQIKTLQNKQENETHTQILAPMSGTVVARFVYEGQYVKEGDKLFEIADFSTMWFLFDVYERDLSWVKAGQLAEVTTRAVPGKVYTAPITFIDPNLNEPTRSAKARVELPNPIVGSGKKARELYHNLYAEALIKSEWADVRSIPRSAVLSPGQNPVVYVDKGGGAYEQRAVKLGRLGDELWEVLEGVEEGERVVTNGNLLIDAQAQLDQSARAPAQPQTSTPEKNEAASASPAKDSAAGVHQHAPPAGQGKPVAGTAAKPAAEKLSEAQRKAAEDFMTMADAVARGLSSDNLAEFNQQAAKLHSSLEGLLKTLAEADAWQPLLEKIRQSGPWDPAPDLKAARQAFLPFSTAVVEFARKLRAQQPEFSSLKIYQCPMVNLAIPGAPKTSWWMQTRGPIRNPFYGAAMLDCGTEVKP
ncbi:MAG: efflux RND transporter periplasmic adaptor subunit [Chloroflexi bacterium]|nr:efflux RND transporter periplasmic adaptor subunit [Chloroflexota bacterium]